MKKEELIVLKKISKFTNPAKNDVVQSQDSLMEYFKVISQYPTLSAKEEKLVAKLAKEGDIDAKQKLIEANLRLVVTIAKKVIHTSELPLTDLIQEGNLGLMIAADKFNYKLGYKFATYASWWIKQSMFKAISEQSHCMKIPVYIQETLSKFSKVKAEMEQKDNRTVNIADVAKQMNISINKIETYLSAYVKPISIEGGLEKDDGKELSIADILADENSCVHGDLEYENLKRDIESVISTLKVREQDVIKMRFGIGDSTRRTLEEIGNTYGVTKECIRQTERRALDKMKLTGREILSGYIC